MLISYRSLHIKSTHGAASTFIVGGHDPDTASGLGDKAIRCVDIEVNNSYTNVIEGFTLCDGATRDVNGVSGQGGALHVSEGGNSPIKDTAFLVDCVVTNCIGASSEIAFGGTFVRCRVQDNAFVACSTEPTRYLSRGSAYFNTLFFRNRVVDNTTHETLEASIFLANGGRFVNCTFAHNEAKFYSHDVNYFYNCAFSGTLTGEGQTKYLSGFNDSTSARALIAPVLGDVRVRAGSAVIGTGDAAYATDETIIPLQTLFPMERMKDLYGQDIPSTGAICAGCAQTTVVPAAGAIVANDVNTYFGSDTGLQRAATYLHPTAYPVSYRLHGGATRAQYAMLSLAGMSLKQTQSSVRFPSRDDDSLEVIPPPASDGVLTVRFVSAPVVKYADANTQEETTGQDGSAEHPFKTLQQALDSVGDGGGVVIARPGVYDSGFGERVWSDEGISVKVRAYFKSKFIRLISSGGPEVTSIVGAPDPLSEDGCGSGVTLLAAIDGTAGIQGFTLTDGYSTKGGTWGSGRGCIYSYGTDLHMTDCILTNNVGYNYALGTMRFERCLIAGNTGRLGLTIGAKMISCAVAGNTVEDAGGVLFDESGDFPAYLLNCAVAGDGAHALWAANSANSLRVNTLVDGAVGVLPSAGYCSGCVFNGFAPSAASGFVAADPYFCNKTATDADLRVISRSPALTAGTPKTALADSDWWYLCASDCNGTPWSFDGEGRVVSGAFQEIVSGGVYVASGKGLAVVSGGQMGFNAYNGAEGRTLTFAFEPGASRPINGLVINDVTNLFTEAGQSTTFAFSPSKGDALVKPLYGNKWYVRPGSATDPTASGYNATCAFGTLRQALSNAALATGDTVVALPGVYEAETMDVSATAIVKARAVIPDGVTLAAQGGWTNTFIKGAACKPEDTDQSSTAAYNDYIAGMGKSSVRGVYLKGASSVVEGFTLTNCFVRGASDTGGGLHNNLEGCGAGVAGYGRAKRCRFVDCHAFRGGGAYLSTTVDCLFERCWGFYGGGASDNAYHYGCLSRENRSVSSNLGDGFFYWGACENCTTMDGVGGPRNGSALMKNTLVLAAMRKGDVAEPSGDLFSRCAFATDVGGVQATDYRAAIEAGTGNLLVPSDSLQVDADGRPVIGKCLAVDAGDPGLNSSFVGERDLLDGQRVYNAVQDIGALEGDWRPTYAKAIRGSRFSVQAASPEVVTNAAGRVVLADGTCLVGTLEAKNNGAASCFLDVQVTDGALTASVDGVETVYTADARITIPEPSVAHNISFAYAGAGDAIIGRMKSDCGILLIVR